MKEQICRFFTKRIDFEVPFTAIWSDSTVGGRDFFEDLYFGWKTGFQVEIVVSAQKSINPYVKNGQKMLFSG